jgi:hypothetical protein
MIEQLRPGSVEEENYIQYLLAFYILRRKHNMLDINKRKNLSGMTVGELIHELSQLPTNARFLLLW